MEQPVEQPVEQPDVLELTSKLDRIPDVGTALHIMQWNLGELAKSWTYMKWHDDDAMDRAWKQEILSALSSLLFQAEVVARLLGSDLETLRTLGVDTVKDRIEDKDKRRGRFKYYVGDKED